VESRDRVPGHGYHPRMPETTTPAAGRADAVRSVFRVLREQDAWRATTLNMIASENTLSPLAMAAQNSDFNGRYAEGHPGARYYEGTRLIDGIETRLEEEIRALFRCRRAEVRAISGTVANDAVFSTVVPKGSTVLAHGVPAGGHVSHQRYGALGKVAGSIKPIPRGKDGVSVDVAKTLDLLRKEKPSAIVLGRSLFLFPEPVAELAPACRELGVTVLFDAAHVLGLVAGGEFQDPLHEGADVMMGSTHKTFFGPQRGLVVSDTPDDALWKKVDRGVFPGCTSNHHLFTLPAMLVATLEFREFGAGYARDVVRNAQAFAKALHGRGVPVVGEERGFTRSHQVAVDCSPFGGGKESARRLCEQGIVANSNMLPGDDPKTALDPRGIRFGVQEMTRFGAGPDDMGAAAELVEACLRRNRVVTGEVQRLRARLSTVRYTFEGDLGRAR
jgi:glycine hydroxymethyltransferase